MLIMRGSFTDSSPAFFPRVQGGAAEHYPDIRLYTVQKCGGGGPHACVRRGPGPALEFLNASYVGQHWVPASSATVYGSRPWTPADYNGWEGKIGQVEVAMAPTSFGPAFLMTQRLL